MKQVLFYNIIVVCLLIAFPQCEDAYAQVVLPLHIDNNGDLKDDEGTLIDEVSLNNLIECGFDIDAYSKARRLRKAARFCNYSGVSLVGAAYVYHWIHDPIDGYGINSISQCAIYSALTIFGAGIVLDIFSSRYTARMQPKTDVAIKLVPGECGIVLSLPEGR